MPDYFQKIEDVAEKSGDDSSVIVELVNVGERFDIFRKEPSLVLEAVDLNSKNFSFVLAQVLTMFRLSWFSL